MSSTATSPLHLRRTLRRPALAAEWLLLACCLFWALALNGRFLGSAGGAWTFRLALVAALAALHFLLFAPWLTRWSTKPLLAAAVLAGAFGSWFIERYGVVLDPAMMRNVLRTDLAEARELLAPAMLPHLLATAGPPLALLALVRVEARSPVRALLGRLGWMALAAAVLVGAVLAVFQPLASLVRAKRETRYLVTPANLVLSLAGAARRDAALSGQPRQRVGEDARLGPTFAGRARPAVVVLVVGETARAANWGLAGYARQTTPQLAQLPVIPFTEVTSCGTDTETSLPCMFAAVGRRDYDEGRIRGSENLLHVLARAGVGVQWRDNQSGCKGVCDGFGQVMAKDLAPPALCHDGHCLDEALLLGLPERLSAEPGPRLVVLHQLGNHGPSYWRRVPEGFARFQPACNDDDLGRCSVEQVVNAYDNALLYTDHVLAALVRQLRSLEPQVDSALVYVSDHGESLGEHGLFLHGLPYAIAPQVQKRVPMLMWLSDGFTKARGVQRDCLVRRAAQPASHDHLFHTLLGLFDVRTAAREPALDLLQGCTAR